MNIQVALELLSQAAAGFSPTPGLDAQVMLAHILSKERGWIIAHPEAKITGVESLELKLATARLTSGEPLPHILGCWEFYGLPFIVTPDVLIPRPETELLVDHAKVWLKAHPERRWALDVGTGSGCIAISLAAHIPDLCLVASEISWQALSVARKNLEWHQLSQRVHLLSADLLSGIEPLTQQKFDLIVANLPYIPANTLQQLVISRWEPRLALDGGDDGLHLIRRLLEQAPDRLAPGGMIILEIEYRQGNAAVRLAASAFSSATISLLTDLAGHDRLVLIQS